MDHAVILQLLLGLGVLVVIIILTKLPEKLHSHFKDNTEQLSKQVDTLGDKFFQQGKELREELSNQFRNLNQIQTQQLEVINRHVMQLLKEVQTRLEHMRKENTDQLERIRGVVDEKLTTTLNESLKYHFRTLQGLLRDASKSLGEIRSLSENVVDLKRVLTGIRSRGAWGEIQLEGLLSEFLTPGVQYFTNVKVKPNTDERVEFAIKLPGQYTGKEGVLLPIDSKFPIEAYERLLKAQENADKLTVAKETQELVRVIKTQAQKITKYIAPPKTTNFAIMYLPLEGLYAEVVKIPGLVDDLRRRFNVVVTGPSTFTAFVLSLQMGFKTLAIQKRTQDVWKLLAVIRKDFEKFGTLLQATIKDLDKTKRRLEDAMHRSELIKQRVDRLEDMRDEVEQEVPGNPVQIIKKS